ncbi:MAG: phosphoglycerate kinase [Clostridiales Family XIII bacterium]|jgi:phosphoglycerate kinase|nr:phosphoglycerate kinase [Clostridiales Family XIII bacterium]
MEENAKELLGINAIDDLDLKGKTVLLRLDINAPISPETKKIANENRIVKSLPTVRKILGQGAKLAIIAHQGDTLDYHNLISMAEHAERLSAHLEARVDYIDDVAGPSAQERIRSLREGEAVLLGNLRYLTEEVSTFENAVTLTPPEMLDTWLVRNLAPLFDCYVNDAFSAAHRNSPSMVAFQQLLPTAGGELLIEELTALTTVAAKPQRPCVFILGGAKISDAFGMIAPVLRDGTADVILTCGVVGEVFLAAQGAPLGAAKTQWLADRGLQGFIGEAQAHLSGHAGKIHVPSDLAYAADGARAEIDVKDLPKDELFMDVGVKTIEAYQAIIAGAGTVFLNGPAGAYEDPLFESGTREIWEAVAASKAYSVIGGGDTVSAAQKFIDTDRIGYVCTAGGAMVRFLSGKELPLVTAMKNARKA